MFVAMVEKNTFLIVHSLDGVSLHALIPWMLVFGVEVSVASKVIGYLLHISVYRYY